jgi:RNA polymerase sigma-70 factor, ECF subfamily
MAPPGTLPARGSLSGRVEYDRLFSALYEDLRQIAHRHLRWERPDHTLDATALVHEAYVRLCHRDEIPWRDPQRFRAFISTAMRRILVDHARRRGADKRGGGAVVVTLQPGSDAVESTSADLLALDAALARLGALNERLEQVVECRFFGGLSVEETAEALGISGRTAERDWTRARTYLHDLLSCEQSLADGTALVAAGRE